MNLEEKQINSKKIFKGKIIDVDLDTVLLPNGKEAMREVVYHKGAVCVAALTNEKELLFVKQFRYPYREELLEVPAGKLEGGDKLDNAKRELKEETGAIGENYKYLGHMYPSPGFTDEIVHMYLCNVSHFEDSSPDEDEFLDVIKIPMTKCLEMVYNDEIQDAKTQLLILKVAKELDNR